jgi:adenylate cyclase
MREQRVSCSRNPTATLLNWNLHEREAFVERRLAAILAADAVGYSRMMGEDEPGTLALLQKHRSEVIDPALAKHRGRTVKLMGDGLLAEFSSVVESVNCAAEIQRAMAARNAGPQGPRKMAFRIGVHLGDVIVEGDDLYGDGVNIAARLEGIAERGGICISRQALRSSAEETWSRLSRSGASTS